MFIVYYIFILLLLWVDLIETAITASTTTLTPKRATYDYKEFNEFIIWNRQINCKTTETPIHCHLLQTIVFDNKREKKKVVSSK